MSCRNLLGLSQRRSTFPDRLETESGIPCIPAAVDGLGRMAERSPFTRLIEEVRTFTDSDWHVARKRENHQAQA